MQLTFTQQTPSTYVKTETSHCCLPVFQLNPGFSRDRPIQNVHPLELTGLALVRLVSLSHLLISFEDPRLSLYLSLLLSLLMGGSNYFSRSQKFPRFQLILVMVGCSEIPRVFDQLAYQYYCSAGYEHYQSRTRVFSY